MSNGLVVVGSGPAGVSAAQAWRDAGGPGPVTVLSADVDPAYSRPPLSKEILRGDAPPQGQPIDPDDPDLSGITLRLGTRVDRVDVEARVVHAGGQEIAYDELVVASGSAPSPLPGAEDDAEVHLLRSLDDARSLVTAAGHARTALVVGSGFIGCEAAVSLARRGIEVTMVSTEQAPQVERLGDRAARLLTDWLTEEGVTVVTGVEVTSVHAPREVHLSDGTTRSPDLVLAALGVRPSTDWLDGSPVQRHEGRVVVDEHLAASVPHVWAAGDASRAQHAVAGRPLEVEHWGDALTMGEIAGRNAAAAATGEAPTQAWDAAPGFWSQIGDRTLKYSAWGDGWDEVRVVERPGGLTVWYGLDGVVVGALTSEADDDYERAEQLMADRAPLADA